MDRRLPLILLPAAAAAALALRSRLAPPAAETELVLLDRFVASSSSPLDLEAASNALALLPVRSGLISTGKRGEIRGVLARRWEASEDFRRWRFEFRNDLAFETGETIRPSHLARAWTRLAAELRRRGSEDPLLSKLEGWDAPGPDGSISGLSHDETSVTLRFRKPFPRLLAHAGNVAYAVTAESCWDARSGAWVCERKAVSSGPYRVERWDRDSLTLRLRPDFPARDRHPRAPRVIRIGGRSAPAGAVPVHFQDSKSPPEDPAFRFSGGMESAVGYAYCNSWTHPESPCRDAGARRRMRERFAARLREGGRGFPNSFFPLSVPGIREGDPKPRPADAAPKGALRVPTRSRSPAGDPVHAALELAAKDLGISLVERPVDYARFTRDLVPGLPEYEHDLTYFTSGIDPEDPVESLRAMFLSRESSRLPDPTGRIRTLLEQEPVDLPAVNDGIWDDALIWPLGHVQNGLWTKGGADLSLLNANNAVPALQWVGID